MPRKKSSEKETKKRHWAFVLYPESAPADWMEQLQQTGLPCAISPLHDRDTNPTGEPKKAHRHIMVFYNGPTSFNVVERLTKSLNQPIPKAVENVRGYYRYLTHEDNPEKAQYSKSDIQALNGFNIGDFVEMTKSEVEKLKQDITQFIMDNDLREYADIVEVTMSGAVPPEWFGIVSNHTMYFSKFLSSRRYRIERKQQ